MTTDHSAAVGPTSPIDEIIDVARNGKMYILVDDKSAETRGAFLIPAQMATPRAVNFMATHGRGLICLALDRERAQAMGLAPMSPRHGTRENLAFTVSIEARTGVTTGISAADRARTISAAVDGASHPSDLVTPGHVFPLVSRDGGVLIRAGLTEAAVDVSRLAGLNPSGVVCDIMNDDGSMATMAHLIALAERHELKVAKISDLIAYRLRHDRLVERISDTTFASPQTGTWRAIAHRNRATGRDTLSLIKGEIDLSRSTLVRLHGLNLFGDVLGDVASPHAGQLQEAMRVISEAGVGAIVITQRPLVAIIPDPGSGGAAPAAERDNGTLTAECCTGAQVLADLGIEDVIVLGASGHDAAALAAFGLRVAGELMFDSAQASAASVPADLARALSRERSGEKPEAGNRGTLPACGRRPVGALACSA